MSIPGNANPLLLASAAAADAAAGPIKSVRFNSADSAYLNRTPSSAGNRKTFTFAFWIKKVTTSTTKRIFNCGPYTAGTGYRSFNIVANGGTPDPFYMWDYSSSYKINLVADVAHRDDSAWYHLVWAVDTTQATESDRVKLYINGTQFTNFATGGVGAVYPAQNYETGVGVAEEMRIGVRENKTSQFLDGYLADFYYIDGSALDATSFGAFDDSGVWQSASYSGTFGTNGFHLFDFANESGIGNDSSGNDNDFTVNNISLPDAGTPVASATGAKPIFATTDGFGQTVGTGLATDDDASDLELCAPLTDGSGAASMTDRSPTGRTSSALTLTNNSSSDITVSTSTGYFYGESLNFSGSHSGVDVAGIDIWNSNFTLEGWFRRTGTGSLQTLFDTWYGQTSGVGFYVWWDGTNIDVVKDSSTYYDNGSGTTLPLNTWQHIALTRNGTTIKIYVDGTQYSSFTPSDSTWTSSKLRIGDAVSNGSPFVGQIQDVRAYSGLKYTGNFTVPAKPVTSANDDVLFDVPTNGTQSDTGAGGEVSGNYCTMNPLDKAPAYSLPTFSNGNLDVACTTYDFLTWATIQPSSGKWYYEHTVTDDGGSTAYTSQNRSIVFGDYTNKNTLAVAWRRNAATAGLTGSPTFDTYATGDVLGVAIDLDNNQAKFFKNGVAQGNGGFYTFTNSNVGNPLIIGWFGKDGLEGSFNFGQRAFAYSAPSGYKALCTTNLPTPTIADGSDYFDVKTYTGNGSTQTISGLEFSPDLVWIKSRSGAYSHLLFDQIRGTTKYLRSDNTGAEGTDSNSLTAFTSDGFSVGTTNAVNQSSGSLVAWTWDAGANSSKTFTVKVVSDSGNKYRFDDFGTSAVTLDLEEGSTYVFDQSDSSNSGHPLRFSTTSDGTHNSGSEYTTGVTTTGTPGSAGAKTTIVVAASAPTLYYYCSAHSGMGGQANTNSTAGASNFDGSIQTTVRANQTAGFSIITFTMPTVTTATIGHGLNAAPAVYFWKDRDTADSWYTYHSALGAGKYLTLNGTGAAISSTVIWNNTDPTNSVINTGSTFSNTGSQVIYAFSPVSGFSSMGEYTGNGSSDGPFVYTGMRPRWIMTKASEAAGSAPDWLIFDTERDPFNEADKNLSANYSGQEQYYSGNLLRPTDIDILSNGFKLRNTRDASNKSSKTYIYIAFAENPFQANGGLAR